MDAQFFTKQETEAIVYGGLNDDEILDELFAKPNGCEPWLACQHNPVIRILGDGTRVPLGCDQEATSEFLLEHKGKRLQLWLCADHADALCNTLGLAPVVQS